ncbi:DegV family protein [Lentilactobacillus sp. Marseille-Q4993]|uniref:DegV family protein n=1 Tax=Lentilactobacillus sp. Marseille-Q4993 TaxID=3039492 RepID=UPI0024BD27FB|nr:DegV family protein [Lentilactobacillus sp. Marseille-Q4993]
MDKIKIVTDSAVQLPHEQLDALNVQCIDLPVSINGKQIGSVMEMTSAKFCHLMTRCDSKPEIGEVSPSCLTSLYNELGADGSIVLSLHLSSQITNTYYNAKQAAAKASTDVLVVDSCASAVGLEFQVLKAAQMAKQGADSNQILTELENTRNHTKTFFSVTNNCQLISNRIINKFIGTIEDKLKTSYVLQFENNCVNLIERSRQSDVISNFWVEKLENLHREKIVKLTVIHSGEPSLAKKLKEIIQREFPFVPVSIDQTKPELTSYIGPESTGITYLTG